MELFYCPSLLLRAATWVTSWTTANQSCQGTYSDFSAHRSTPVIADCCYHVERTWSEWSEWNQLSARACAARATRTCGDHATASNERAVTASNVSCICFYFGQEYLHIPTDNSVGIHRYFCQKYMHIVLHTYIGMCRYCVTGSGYVQVLCYRE